MTPRPLFDNVVPYAGARARGSRFANLTPIRRILVGACATMMFSAAPALADVLQVPGEYPTIQAAVDASMDGDTVLVADGTYTGPGNRDIDFGDRLIAVRSVNGPQSCIIDCEYAGRAFDNAHEVEGFTKRYRVHRLAHFEAFDEPEFAIGREKSLKKWPRKWKLDLIEKGNPEWRDLWDDIYS